MSWNQITWWLEELEEEKQLKDVPDILIVRNLTTPEGFCNEGRFLFTPEELDKSFKEFYDKRKAELKIWI